MTAQEIWNIIDIAFLILAVWYNFRYYHTHANGKKLVRLISAISLSVVLILRSLLGLHILVNEAFQQLLRPWAVLVYVLPMMDAYVDWNKNKRAA